MNRILLIFLILMSTCFAGCFEQNNLEKSQEMAEIGFAYIGIDNDKAIEYYEKAIKLNPDDANAISFLGTLYDGEGDREKAYEYLTKALEMEPKNPWMYYNLGLYYLNHDDNMAIGCFEKALRIDPENECCWSQLGYTYYDIGDYTNSKLNFEKAYEINPKDQYSDMIEKCNEGI
ncbi:tetratricopeptide repeat protein [Methanococcus maripaludis]|nr:tetratricopeptide repeat protein [Methanococcus maripaludis]